MTALVLSSVNAAPGVLSGGHLVYPMAVPLAASAVVHEPVYGKVHATTYVKSIPTAVSHQSVSQVHSTAHLVHHPIVAPVVKTTAYGGPLLSSTGYGSVPYVHSYGSHAW